MEALKALLDPRVTAASVTGFLILWAVLAKYLFKPMMGLLKEREEEIKNTYANADAAREDAEKLKSDLDNRLAGIEAEARARIQDAIKDAQKAKDDILAEARSRSEDLLRRGQEDLAREREKTLAELREDVVNLSLAATGKLIGESMDDARHRKLVGEFIDKVDTLK
jgi:F-type H+-transporting ATPase subunit b